MGTKINPGKYDCYALAEPDEPMFTLLARDRDAAMIVKMWAFFRIQQIDIGIRPEEDRAQVSEAIHLATEMDIWHQIHRNKKDREGIEFDREGYPIKGPHKRLTKNTTSGANDK